MTSRRVLKAAEAIREVVGMAILVDINDPRVQDATVTYVEVSPDMRQARVHVSVMGEETKQRLCIRGLKSAAGFLQRKVGNRIDTRYTPKLDFVLDKGVKHSLHIDQILGELLPDDKKKSDETAGDSPTETPQADTGNLDKDDDN